MRISVYLNDLLRQSFLLFAIRFKEEEEFSDKPGLFFNRLWGPDRWYSFENDVSDKRNFFNPFFKPNFCMSSSS
ncbi:hypothetical protein LEP1GSC058_0841 [Leptospira fainei serovar Hurstbridge str. BUT 6]|uniref:Uncharacterized protein n=1 Tax=Leptospira fainei serovar Hurstbridge str. BUT 6 TaxID=1193011 RepID=S3UZ74_9LEPT|nr:hypothetical protein LEP1GSC058_0841 [Leptospira fainei serovar Hurstbridge str. BUT 6]